MSIKVEHKSKKQVQEETITTMDASHLPRDYFYRVVKLLSSRYIATQNEDDHLPQELRARKSKAQIFEVPQNLIVPLEQGLLWWYDFRQRVSAEIYTEPTVVSILPSRVEPFYYFVHRSGLVQVNIVGFRTLALQNQFQMIHGRNISLSILVEEEVEKKFNKQFKCWSDRYIFFCDDSELFLYDMLTHTLRCSASLDSRCVWLGHLFKENTSTYLAFTENKALHIFSHKSDRLVPVTFYVMDQEVLLLTNRKYLFLAIKEQPFTFSIFSLSGQNSLILKSNQGFKEHLSPIQSIDCDMTSKLVLTADIHEIKIWNFKKLLLFQIKVQTTLFMCKFSSNETHILCISKEGVVTQLKVDDEIIINKKKVSKSYEKIGQSFILSMSDFFKQNKIQAKPISKNDAQLDPFYSRRNSQQVPSRLPKTRRQPEKFNGTQRFDYKMTLNKQKVDIESSLFENSISFEYRPKQTRNSLASMDNSDYVFPTIKSKKAQLNKSNDENKNIKMETIKKERMVTTRYKKIYNLHYYVSVQQSRFRSQSLNKHSNLMTDKSILPAIKSQSQMV